MPRESLDAPENLPKERRRQVALGQLEDEVSGMSDETSAGLEQALLQARQRPVLDGDRQAYNLGNLVRRLVHTFASRPGVSKDLVGDLEFIEVPPECLLALTNLVRASILYFIALQDSSRDEVLGILDRSLFDPSEVATLRRRANEYWGFTGREDELLCSGRWAA
jgi:hypothetical protein